MNAPFRGNVVSAVSNRRSFVAGLSALLMGSLAADTTAQNSLPVEPPQTATQDVQPDLGLGPNPTTDAVLKFNADGTAKPFAGNTVIAHLPAQGTYRDGTTRLHEGLAKSSFANKLALLPPESFHMTIFNGANDLGRDNSNWPGGVPVDASIDDCNRMMLGRMGIARVAAEFPLQVKIDIQRTLTYGRACTLRMVGANDRAAQNLQYLRQQLAAVYRIRPQAHDQYGFHITIAYTMHEFSNAEKREYREVLHQHVNELITSVPVLELGLAEYCTFPNMYRFDVAHLIRVS